MYGVSGFLVFTSVVVSLSYQLLQVVIGFVGDILGFLGCGRRLLCFAAVCLFVGRCRQMFGCLLDGEGVVDSPVEGPVSVYGVGALLDCLYCIYCSDNWEVVRRQVIDCLYGVYIRDISQEDI